MAQFSLYPAAAVADHVTLLRQNEHVASQEIQTKERHYHNPFPFFLSFMGQSFFYAAAFCEHKLLFRGYGGRR